MTVSDRGRDKKDPLLSHLTVRLNCYSDVMLRFINEICSVNISPGASGAQTHFNGCSGSFIWSQIYEPCRRGAGAVGREIIFTASKKKENKVFVLCSGSIWNLKFPADKENSRWVLCNYFLYAHVKACSFINLLRKRELLGLEKLAHFGFYIPVLSRKRHSFSSLHQSTIISSCYFLFPCTLPLTRSILRSC